MKKIMFFLLLASSISASVFSQFAVFGSNYVTATDPKIAVPLTDGVDEIYFFKRTGTVEIRFTHSESVNFKWYKYTTNYALKTEISSNVGANTSIELADNDDFNAGYELTFDGQTKRIWVIDLNTVQPLISAVNASDGADPCKLVEIEVVARNPAITYYGVNTAHNVPRLFTLTYNTLEWDGKAYKTKETVVEKRDFPTGDIAFRFSVEAPLTKTTFTLKTDQFLAILGGELSHTSAEYQAVAIDAHLTGTIIERPFKNEQDRVGTSTETVNGSAPLVVEFNSNANVPVARYFEWDVYSKSENNRLLNHYTDENLQYTFKQSGVYGVKLLVVNAENGCEKTDSIVVRAIESALEVPNAFTPNGDGINDEFRVAYKSIATFYGVVYNRWGRKVFEWTDPGKGWDGRIGARLAEPGAYYYIIEAEGTDIDPDTKKPVKYHRKGDINLIRGK